MIEIMRRINIPFLCLLLLAASWQEAFGFALLGPLSGTAGLPATDPDPIWQTTTIGYNLGGDNGTPRNVGQGYRWNTPVLFYADDESFSGYFGLQGEQAIDSAFNILNNTFTNNSYFSLNGYSSNLVEFPFNSQSYNYTAQSLGLTDLKSETLDLMAEELGLAEPERYTWTLRQRFLPSGGTCPLDELYLVVQRNYYYTPTPLYQNLYSPYVNDTLYTYAIDEFCSAPLPPLAVTVPIAVDPYAQTYTAVAGLGVGLGVENITGSGGSVWSTIESGGYYTGLTRDDVGGLRYLMSTNNIVWEDPAAGAQLEATNFTLQPLTTQPLGPLLQFAQTNPPAALQALYPGLFIDSVSNYYTLVTNPVVVSYFTNFYGYPASYPPQFVIFTNGYTYAWQTNYVYTFGNMVIFDYHSNTPAILQTISLMQPYGYPPGDFITNVSSQNIILSNQPSGQFYLIPTNSCGFDIVKTNVLNAFAGYYTNEIVATATNSTTIATGFVGSQTILERLTNSFLQYYACNFETSGPAFYQGIGRMQFVRVPDNNVDSLTGLLRQPVTNTYSMVWYNPTNSTLGTRVFQRVAIQPDIVILGSDMAAPVPPAIDVGVPVSKRSIPNWDLANIVPGWGGPGTINPPVSIAFDEVGDIYGNGSLAENLLATNGFLSQLTQAGLLAYGTFDGTTNTPVVYPNGTSIQDLENELVITVSPSLLPNGTNDITYPTTTFSVTGGQAPFSWSYSGTLPEGLNFYNGVLSGTPVNNAVNAGQNYGTYDFNIIVTGGDNRTVSIPYSINIYQSP
jgi:hypothetical protein